MTEQDRKIALEIVTKRPMQPDWESLMDDIAAAISAARGRWIPVGEGLPKDTRDLQFMDSSGRNYIGYFRSAVQEWNCLTNEQHMAAKTIVVRNVTHWRELPEPPQEGGSNGA